MDDWKKKIEFIRFTQNPSYEFAYSLQLVALTIIFYILTVFEIFW